jgi:hypothetical protein
MLAIYGRFVLMPDEAAVSFVSRLQQVTRIKFASPEFPFQKDSLAAISAAEFYE